MTRRRTPLLWVGLALVGAFGLIALLAPLLAPYDPQAVSGPSLSAPSTQHLLGTNDAGQDILSQLIWGARSSAVVAILAGGLAVALGGAIGGISGLAGGWTDVVVMRVVDLCLAIPAIPLLILVAALAGPSQTTIVLVIGLAGWPGLARVVRSEALRLRHRGFVEAARGFGAGPLYLLRRHVIPSILPLLTAAFVAWAATAVVLQAGLAFLGLSDPTDVSWGAILNRAINHEGVYFTSEWLWWVLPAGLAVTLAATGLAFIGVAVEPRSNPRWSRA